MGQKPNKPFVLRLNVLNVKILPVQTGQYADLFQSIHKEKIFVDEGKWRTQIVSVDQTTTGLVAGHIVSYSTEKHIDVFNQDEGKIETLAIDGERYTSPKECQFFFVPEAHRLAISMSKGVNLERIQSFVQKAIERLLVLRHDTRSVHVCLEVSEDFAAVVYQLRNVQRLRVSISYTNDDMHQTLAQFLDDQFRQGKVEKAEITAQANKTIPLNIQPETLLGSAIKLAQSNGVAEVVDGVGRARKTYRTGAYPRVELVATTMGQMKYAVYERITQIYRDNAEKKI